MDGFRSRSEPPLPLSIFPDLGDPCPALTLTPPTCTSILKMFSADKKRVETALESCGLNFNRVCGGRARVRVGQGGVSQWAHTFWDWLRWVLIPRSLPSE